MRFHQKLKKMLDGATCSFMNKKLSTRLQKSRSTCNPSLTCLHLLTPFRYHIQCFPTGTKESTCYHLKPSLTHMIPNDSTRFHWISLSFHGNFTEITGFQGIPRDFTGFHGISRDFTGFIGIPRNSTGFHGIPRDSTRFHAQIDGART